MVYTHPIGFYGHGPGQIIGQTSDQKFVLDMDEFPIHNNTCYALELFVRQYVKMLDMTILYGQEIDILFKNNHVVFFSGRQENLHII
ncbi:MAG: hypothetical protein JEZ08_09330 [Clostridiales bacterium]|nr:hypothetical protein [Clostridiales bacterium]